MPGLQRTGSSSSPSSGPGSNRTRSRSNVRFPVPLLVGARAREPPPSVVSPVTVHFIKRWQCPCYESSNNILLMFTTSRIRGLGFKLCGARVAGQGQAGTGKGMLQCGVCRANPLNPGGCHCMRRAGQGAGGAACARLQPGRSDAGHLRCAVFAACSGGRGGGECP